jgi:hypothetical protein
MARLALMPFRGRGWVRGDAKALHLLPKERGSKQVVTDDIMVLMKSEE